jgi:hypothetical protein
MNTFAPETLILKLAKTEIEKMRLGFSVQLGAKIAPQGNLLAIRTRQQSEYYKLTAKIDRLISRIESVAPCVCMIVLVCGKIKMAYTINDSQSGRGA